MSSFYQVSMRLDEYYFYCFLYNLNIVLFLCHWSLIANDMFSFFPFSEPSIEQIGVQNLVYPPTNEILCSSYRGPFPLLIKLIMFQYVAFNTICSYFNPAKSCLVHNLFIKSLFLSKLVTNYTLHRHNLQWGFQT